jgi:hypothetical protein
LDTGTKISGAAHVALVAWALFGVGFDQEPLPFSTQQVSLITAEDFAALSVQNDAPEVSDQATAMAAPDATEQAPVTPAAEEPQPDRTAALPPEPSAAPEALPVAEPAPPTQDIDATDSVTLLVMPEEPITTLPQSPAPRPEPRRVDRVAPTPVAAPPPDAEPDPVVQEEAAPEPDATEQREEQDNRAPEEATDRIVTEADDTSVLAPTSAPRPPNSRPSPPVRPAETQEPVSAAQPADVAQQPARQDAVAAALSEALNETQSAAPAAGPPLTRGEKDALRVAVSQCWNVGSLSSSALATTVVVAVDMTRDGKPVVNSIRMLSSEGGSADAARQAFEAARRAIIRCGARGYDLPSEKYAQWQDIEMTFNPERMRIR